MAVTELWMEIGPPFLIIIFVSSLAKQDETIQSTFEGLLTTNVLPWGVFGKHASTRINRVALKVGNLIQAMLLLIWIPYTSYYCLLLFFTINIPSFYSPFPFIVPHDPGALWILVTQFFSSLETDIFSIVTNFRV